MGEGDGAWGMIRWGRGRGSGNWIFVGMTDDGGRGCRWWVRRERWEGARGEEEVMMLGNGGGERRGGIERSAGSLRFFAGQRDVWL